MLKKLSLQQRLCISIVAVLALCLFIITAYSYKKSSDLINEEAYARATEMSSKYALQIEKQVEDAFSVSRSMAATTMALKRVNSLTRDGVVELLKDNLKLNDLYFGIGSYWETNSFDGKDEAFKNDPRFGGKGKGRLAPWVRRDKKDGISIEGSDSEEMETEGVGDWYLIVRKNQRESIVEPYPYPVSDGSQVVIMTPSVPLLADGKFYGVASIDIKIDTIQTLLKDIKPYETGFATLVSSNLKYIAHPDSKMTDQPLEKEHSEDVTKAIKEGKAFTYDSKDKSGEEFFNVLAPIQLGKTGKYWGLIVSVPKSKVLAGTKRLAFVQGTFSVISLIIVSVLIIFLSLGITKPLMAQNSAVEGVANHLTTYSNNLLDISKSLADSSLAQSNALVETASAMDEINSMVSRNNDSAKKSKFSSDGSKEAALAGKAATEQMIVSMGQIQESTKNISNQTEKGNQEIQEIIRIIEAITEKTKVINDIVFQTKLLSFNASVEAARAGEHGKGFSIVAEEVGNLAAMSGSASQEITDMLLDSSKKVNDIISKNQQAIRELIHDSNNKVNNGVSSMETFREKLDEIVILSSEVSSLVDEIVEASSQQSIGVAEVSKAINHLDAEAQRNSSMAREASSAAEQVKNNSDDLKHIVKKLDQLISGSK